MSMSTTLPSMTGRTLRSIALAAALAVVIGALPTTAAFADEHRYEGNDRNDRYDRYDRDEHNRHGNERDRGHRYARYPVYVPPPVYYPRHESPGITLFFPLEFH